MDYTRSFVVGELAEKTQRVVIGSFKMTQYDQVSSYRITALTMALSQTMEDEKNK